MFIAPLREPFGFSALGGAFALAGGIQAAIRALFSSGQNGAWTEPSDFSTLFQDAAGTTPVTAVEQPVGLARDKSGRNNHLSQATAAARPVDSAKVNLLTKSEQINDLVWEGAAIGITLTPNTTTAPDGSVTADTLVCDAVAYRYQSRSEPNLLGKTFTFSVWLWSPTGKASIGLRLAGDFTAADQSNTNIVLTTIAQRVSITRTFTSADASFSFGFDNRGSAGGDNIAGSFVAWGAQLDAGSVATRYQRVNTATDYDAAGFPNYFNLDGVDDSLSSAAGGGATSGFFWCQPIKPLGGAGTVRTLWSDAGVNTGYKVQLNAANQLQLSAGNGTAYTAVATAAATVIGTTVLPTVWEDATNLYAQLDGGAIASIARPAVVAGTAGFTEFKDNGAATGFSNVQAYAGIYRTGPVVTAAERATIQAYVRSKAGL